MALALGLAVLAPGCGDQPPVLLGYAEGEYVLVAPARGGTLETLAVSRGLEVSRGDRLFSLDAGEERAGVEEARLVLAAAEHRLADLESGARPTEITALEARLRAAREALSLSRSEYVRIRDLFEARAVSATEFDRAGTALERDQAKADQLAAELATARLGGRTRAVAAARAEAEAARARLDRARWRLDQTSRTSPVDGLVFDTFYDPGEAVLAGRPVVSLLPAHGVIAVFFAPEPLAGELQPGRVVRVAWDAESASDAGSRRSARARISWISPQAEFTPPVIYSSRSRAKLVYEVKAVFSDPAQAPRPGQPLDVTVDTGHRTPGEAPTVRESGS
jgi:HlyD family secretion protein